jgi:hypothetical protein
MMAATDEDRVILLAIVGCSAAMMVMLLTTWYSATLGGTTVGASGWEATKLVSVAVIAFGGVVAAVAGSHLRAPGLAGPFGSKRDLGHLAVVVGGLLLALYVFRAVSPPRFYRVTDLAPTFNGLDDPSTQASVSTQAPLVLSIICAAGLVGAGVRLAIGQPGGFKLAYCLGVVREIWQRR